MKLKTRLTLVMLAFATTVSGQSVQIVSFDQLAQSDAAALKSSPSPGSHVFKQMLQIDLPHTPELQPLSEEGNMELQAFVKLANLNQSLAKDCTHEVLMTIAGQQYRLIWPSKTAAGYSKNRNTPNTTYTVMVANGLLSDFTKIHTLVVFNYRFNTLYPENAEKKQ